MTLLPARAVIVLVSFDLVKKDPRASNCPCSCTRLKRRPLCMTVCVCLVCFSHLPLLSSLLRVSSESSQNKEEREIKLLGRSKLFSPLLSNLVELGPVVLVLIGDASLDRIVRLRLNEDLTDQSQHLANTVRWLPVVAAEDAQAHAAFFVVCHVWVVDFRLEGDDGGFEGVFFWERHL